MQSNKLIIAFKYSELAEKLSYGKHDKFLLNLESYFKPKTVTFNWFECNLRHMHKFISVKLSQRVPGAMGS